MKITLDQADVLTAIQAHLTNEGINISNKTVAVQVIKADKDFEIVVTVTNDVAVSEPVEAAPAKKRKFKTTEAVKAVQAVTEVIIPENLEDVNNDNLADLDIDTDTATTAAVMAQMEGKTDDSKVNRLFGQRKFSGQ